MCYQCNNIAFRLLHHVLSSFDLARGLQPVPSYDWYKWSETRFFSGLYCIFSVSQVHNTISQSMVRMILAKSMFLFGFQLSIIMGILSYNDLFCESDVVDESPTDFATTLLCGFEPDSTSPLTTTNDSNVWMLSTCFIEVVQYIASRHIRHSRQVMERCLRSETQSNQRTKRWTMSTLGWPRDYAVPSCFPPCPILPNWSQVPSYGRCLLQHILAHTK